MTECSHSVPTVRNGATVCALCGKLLRPARQPVAFAADKGDDPETPQPEPAS
jgi:hypothetical protein